MIIGIDARLYGTKHTGIGRYTKNLILNLTRVDKKNIYIIFGEEEVKKDIEKFRNFSWVSLNTKPYTFAEQIINPTVFSRHKLDLLHVPHFNAPLFYSGKLIITIHDLIKHVSTGIKTSTLPTWQYWIKHFIYKIFIFLITQKADSIITPSNYWKEKLTELYPIKADKISVTYEAAEKKVKSSNQKSEKVFAKYNLGKPYLLYVGNLYPHKNVPFLIKALTKSNTISEHKLTLAITCARNAFSNSITADKYIKPLGYVNDGDLSVLYSQSLALVQPSLIEGFGLTGLEAMNNNTPVLSSNATCLPEIYGNAALYFDPKNEEDLIDKIEQILTNNKLRQGLIEKGKIRVKQFSWYKTARLTLKVYKHTS
jgi:glycosyltransferase involved in cell wall biosynthesis